MDKLEKTFFATQGGKIKRILLICGYRSTPLVISQTSCVYCITLVQSLFISCYVSVECGY